MKTLEHINVEDYNNVTVVYDFLNENKIIGNEDAEYNGLWHIHWRGEINNNKILLQIKSIIATQYVQKIYLWVEDLNRTINSPLFNNIKQFVDNKLVEIKVFDRSIIIQAPGPNAIKAWVIQYYEQETGDYRYKTDIFRWVILSVYGGIYTDADTLMLRDVRDIKLNNWSSTWGSNKYAECCILKLEKGSDLYEQLFRNDPRNQQCFLNIQNNLPEAFNWKHDNITLTSLPSTFFDPVWILHSTNQMNLPFLSFNKFSDFFNESERNISMNDLFKGCFSYHWHNHWDVPEIENSPAGKINKDIDKIIKNKYGLTSNKIFNN